MHDPPRCGHGPRSAVVSIDVVTFGEQARAVARYLRKGRFVEVLGHLRLREWEDDGGLCRSVPEVHGRGHFLAGGRSHEVAETVTDDPDGGLAPDEAPAAA